MATLTPWLDQKFYLADGITPNAGGRVFTYEPGTTTKKTSYVSESGAANTNPIILNSAGECNLWLGAGGYKIVNAPANDTDPPAAAIKTWDDVNISGTSGNDHGVVSSIAALKGLDEGAFTTVEVLGYGSANGVGTGLYRWDSTSTAAGNDGTIVTPTVSDGTGRWILTQNTPVKVSQFGASGSSAAVDTAALVAAYTSFGSSIGRVIIDVPVDFGSAVSTPSNVTIEMVDGGYLDQNTYTLTINGPFIGGLRRWFYGAGAISFGLGSVSGIRPEWNGGRADGVTDSSDALVWAAGYASTQYSGIPMELSGGQWVFTKTIRIVRPVRGSGWVLIAKGDGSLFKWAANPYTLTTAPAPTTAATGDSDYGTNFGCMLVLQDGAMLMGGAIIVVEDDENNPTLDVVGNANTWMVNLEGNFGKNPLAHTRINGWSGGMYLGGVISRYNTTSTIGPFGGSYFSEGFKADSCNITQFNGLFFEQMRRGGIPFQYKNSSHCSVNGNWTEGVRSGMVCHYYNSCSNMDVSNLTVGEPVNGASTSGTADAGTNLITGTTTHLLDTDQIYFDTAVAGLSASTLYYVRDRTSTTFAVALTSGGAVVDITGTGSVVWRAAPSSAVRVTNCSNIRFEQLKPETGARWIKGLTWLTGTSSNIEFDGSYDPRQSVANTHSIRPKTHKYKFQTPPNQLVDLADTTVYMWLGFIPNGTTLSMDIWSESGAITAPAFEVFRLTSGSTYTSQGTMTGANISGSGNRVTVTFTFTSEGPFYIRPAGGSGYVNLYYDWNLTYSDALVP